MQRNALFLLALAKGIWSFDAGTANELAPLADRVLAGESLELLSAHGKAIDPAVATSILCATAGPTGQVFRMGYYSNLDQVQAGSIAVISVQGVILKNAMCGIGSMDRASMILQAANHPNVAGIVLDIDTPGGQVSGLGTVHDAILYARQQGKPVIGVINDGSCYSAGYHTASACTEIWATMKTCGVGSIGTMCQFTDTTEADKKAGIKRVAVYATDSTEKNQSFYKALAGDTSAIVKELDELNADFQARIRAQRGAKIKDESKVFKGQTYNATEGVQLGLLDTIGSMQAALAHCAALANTTVKTNLPADPDAGLDDEDDDDMHDKNPISSTTSMKQFPFLAALMGIAAKDFQNNAEGAHLQQVHLDAIEAALQQGSTTAASLATVTAERNTAQTALATTQAAVTANATTISGLQQQVLNAPAATNAPKAGQEQAPAGADKQAAANAWDELDAEALAELKQQRGDFTL